jgi:hypothetical protein
VTRPTDRKPTHLQIEKPEKVMLGLAGAGSIVFFVALIYMLFMG